MSLLMDALRRAEEAKRAANRRPPGADPLAELRLEEPEASPGNMTSRGTLAAAESIETAVPGESELTLEEVPFHPKSAATKTSARAKAAESERRQANERNTARNVFAVKQTTRSRWPLWSFLALVAISTIGLVGYFWWQLQSISTLSPSRTSKPSPAPSAAVLSTPAPPATAAQPQTAVAPLPTANIEVPSPQAAAAPETKLPASPVKPTATPTRATRTLPEDAPPESANAPLLRPSTSRSIADRTLETAYQAWQAGRLDEARRLYEQVLRGDSRNVDALLGLGAIASRQGQGEQALRWYQRVLEADPAEVTAQAALINLRAQNDGGQNESRLRSLLAGQPESATLHFSLGNVFARQQRWKDAQQAYFQAYALEPDNADYLFNVAVSLDHLRQDKLAAQYYRMALDAAEKGRGTFNRDQAVRRVEELQP